MLSKNSAYVLEVALSNAKLADEIDARLIQSTPASPAAAQAILDILDKKLNKQIEEYLIVALAHRPSGKEIAQKINGAIAVLEAHADGDEIAAVAAQAVLDLTADITLTAATAGAARNDDTFTIQVEAAAANPTDTVLVDFSGTVDAITVTVTPNDGTNNGATPVDLTTAELVELINTGSVAGKNVTLTDASSLREEQTASGGDATALADAGEGDGVSGTFSSGSDSADNDLAPAKAAMGSDKMSDATYERLVVAMASRPAAKEFREAYDAMIDAIQAIS